MAGWEEKHSLLPCRSLCPQRCRIQTRVVSLHVMQEEMEALHLGLQLLSRGHPAPKGAEECTGGWEASGKPSSNCWAPPLAQIHEH